VNGGRFFLLGRLLPRISSGPSDDYLLDVVRKSPPEQALRREVMAPKAWSRSLHTSLWSGTATQLGRNTSVTLSEVAWLERLYQAFDHPIVGL
jgi:hypothetical protein